MISKEKYDLINTKCERNYPGICNYNLRYAADEIVHTIYKELLENTYFLSITDIQQDYQLTKPEALKVLEMISKEPDISSKGFVKQDTVELKSRILFHMMKSINYCVTSIQIYIMMQRTVYLFSADPGFLD